MGYENVPSQIDIPDKPVTSILDYALENFANLSATNFFGVELTYRQLDQAVTKMANVLKSLGVKKGDPVSIMAPNCPQFPIAYYAILRLGAIVVPTNPLYVEREIEKQYNEVGVKVAFVTNIFTPRIEAIRKNTKLENVIVIKLDDYMPWLMGHLFNIKLRVEKKYVKDHYDSFYLPWETLLNNGSDDAVNVDIDPSDTAIYLFTGGTTGTAKGAELTHRNVIANAYQCKAWFVDANEGEEIFITALPLFHAFGMTVAMNLAILLGAEMVMFPKFDAEKIMKLVEKHKATIFPGVPAMYVAINNHPKATHNDISSIKYCLSGAAPLAQATKEQFEKLTGGTLVEGYGLSEASPVTHCNPLAAPNKTGSIGLAVPNTESKIVLDDTGEEAPLGEKGELVVWGPQIMKGYLNRPEENKTTIRNGWLFTGDMGYQDEDGFVFLMDRKKDMVISGGFNIYPHDVEDVLYKIDGVKEAAVIGLPDEKMGEKVVAVIVKTDGADLDEEKVAKICAEKLATFKRPRHIVFRDELPKTIIGKTLKRVLKEELSKEKL